MHNLMKKFLSTLGQMLRQSYRLELTKSFQPFLDTYYNLGRLLTRVFVGIKLIDSSHPWARFEAKPRPFEVLAYVFARADWKKPWKPETVLVGSVTTLAFLGVFTLISIGVTGALGAGQAYAGSIFAPGNASTDLALKYMSNSFGVTIPGVPPATVNGVVTGFQKMMALYSMAMLVVAGFILLYIITFAIAETAHSGRFGGGDFNQIWAPIRLVVAIGLLVPLPMDGGYNGYNSGQFIVMKIAEWGSGMADSLWIPFATSLGENRRVLAVPGAAPAGPAVRGVLVNEFCLARHNAILDKLGLAPSPDSPERVQRVQTNDSRRTTIYYTTGVSDTKGYCGVTSYERAADPGLLASLFTSGTFSFVGNDILRDINAAYASMRADVQSLAEELNGDNYIRLTDAMPATGTEDAIKTLLLTRFVSIVENYQNNVATAINKAQDSAGDAAAKALSTEIKDAGWAGAPMWFNTIARMNAEIMSASRAVPSSSLPDFGVASTATTTNSPDQLTTNVMQGVVALQRLLNNLPANMASAGISATQGVNTIGVVKTTSVTDGFTSPGTMQNMMGDGSAVIGQVLSVVFSTSLGGPFAYLGTGVNTQLSQINPLAELAAIGDWILNKSLFMMTVAFGGPTLASFFPNSSIVNMALGVSAFLFMIGIATFAVGVTLFYMLPLLPFIRFLVAIAGWLMSVLEAIIAIPLLSIAHLSMKGSGISGDMARSGYMMIFSIFLRPALLIVGMVAALMMFTVSIGILNDLYKGAVIGFRSTAVGEANGGLSTIIYTIIYCIAAYGLCNQSFKLIEVIPNQAMMWINGQAAREITQDEAIYKSLGGHMHSYMAIPIQSAGNTRLSSYRTEQQSAMQKKAEELATQARQQQLIAAINRGNESSNE